MNRRQMIGSAVALAVVPLPSVAHAESLEDEIRRLYNIPPDAPLMVVRDGQQEALLWALGSALRAPRRGWAAAWEDDGGVRIAMQAEADPYDPAYLFPPIGAQWVDGA
jgi:hypothetical protein